MQRNYNDNTSVPGAASFSLNNFNSIAQFAELYANIKLGKGFDLLGGADYRYSSFNSTYNSLSVYGPYNSTFNDSSVNQTSFFASLHFMSVSKKLNVELGARSNHHSQYGNNTTFTFNPSYQLTASTRIFGSISSGFKVPSLYQLYAGVTPSGNYGPGNPVLKPEESTNYEAGVQWQHSLFNTRLVYFNRNIKNGIDYLNQPYPIPSLYINYIKQIVSGIELEMNVKLSDKLNISGNYTYLSPKETTQNRITNQDTVTYNYLLRRPKNSLNLTIGYQACKQCYLSVNGKYVSSRYDVGGYQKADISLDPYFLLGAYAEYHLCKYAKFFADAQNITNKKFFDVSGYNSIPFMFNAGITVNL
jgi:vitamin B12 transporter